MKQLHAVQVFSRVCVCVCVVIKLHITVQPGPVKLIFQCYSNGSALWGISVCVCEYFKRRVIFAP